jgi:hypothetical protein
MQGCHSVIVSAWRRIVSSSVDSLGSSSESALLYDLSAGSARACKLVSLSVNEGTYFNPFGQFLLQYDQSLRERNSFHPLKGVWFPWKKRLVSGVTLSCPPSSNTHRDSAVHVVSWLKKTRLQSYKNSYREYI